MMRRDMECILWIRSLCRYHSGDWLRPWKITLECNVVSHWLSPCPEWSLLCCIFFAAVIWIIYFMYIYYTPAQRSWIHLVLPSVCPSVCRRHGFRSISQVCFGISISNFICMLMVAIGRSLLIFSDVTFKMAARRPYWIFWFPDSNFTLALNINFKLQRHNTYVYG